MKKSHEFELCPLNSVQLEAIDMILHKISRVVTGNPHVADHWDDIAGYATLAADRIRAAQQEKAEHEKRSAIKQQSAAGGPVGSGGVANRHNGGGWGDTTNADRARPTNQSPKSSIPPSTGIGTGVTQVSTGDALHPAGYGDDGGSGDCDRGAAESNAGTGASTGSTRPRVVATKVISEYNDGSVTITPRM